MKEDASWVLDKLAEIDSHAGCDSLSGIKNPVREICFGSGLLPGCGAGFDFPSTGSAGKPFSGSAGDSASFNPKLSEPGFPLYELLTGADYILAEADGARHHYMKAHAHYEPVIPERCGPRLDDIVTPVLYAEYLRREIDAGLAFDCILINGVDCVRRRDLSEEFAAAFTDFFGGPVVFADLPLA